MRAQAKVIRTVMPPAEPMLNHFERHFRRVLRKAKAHADRVLVVQQPWFDRPCAPEEAAQMWHGGVGQVWREQVATYYSFEVVSRLMALVNERAVRVANEVDVERLDLMPLLERSLVTYYDGFHATPAGARTVAAAVAAAVLQRSRPSSRAPDRADRIDAADTYPSRRTAS